VEAAAADPARITSLSLWHGDFELGARCPKTEHQRNLKALLDMGAAGREDAATIHSALQATAMAVVAPDVAHVVVYPYVTSELFFRYCRLTGAIMGHDVTPVLNRVTQPVLVVTSEDDRTAHPAGSRAVAARFPAGTLHVEPHGDHLSVFAADAPLPDVLSAFMDARRVSA
jgi:pimeloyl-ACP methyl ester carboxylesterase